MTTFESIRPNLHHDAFCGRRHAVAGLRQLVIVDSSCEQHAEFVRAAQDGELGLHFCADGRSALRLSSRFRGDAWLVAAELADMSGCDLLEMLVTTRLQGNADPTSAGGPASDAGWEPMRAAIFLLAEEYRAADEQRVLAAGVAGYLVRPITPDMIISALMAESR